MSQPVPASPDAPQQAPATVLSPVARGGRIVTIDALRGIALLGILLVNVQNIMGPQALKDTWHGVDRVLLFVITWLVEGKFISMFALLFGVGVALQIARARERGRSPTGFLARRFAVLAVFGAAHGIAVWSGDVLLSYAATGFVLLVFRSSSARRLRTWSLGLWGVISVLMLGGVGLIALQGGLAASDPAATVAAYRSGSYAAMVGERLSELASLLPAVVVVLPWTLAVMLAGMALVRAGIAADLAAHRALLRRTAVIGLGAGLALGLAGALVAVAGSTNATERETYSLAIVHVGGPVLALGYLAAGALLLERHVRSAVTARLAAVGRMALTNYLLQSVLVTAWYYTGGRYGTGSLTGGVAVWLVVSVLQLLWSPWWLDRFAQGPMEALWRRLTYRAPARAAGGRPAGSGVR